MVGWLTPGMAAVMLFAIALMFRTRFQLGVYAGLGLVGLCIFFFWASEPPPGEEGPATLALLEHVGTIVTRAATGLIAGVIVKAVYIATRDRRRVRRTGTEISN